MILYPYYCMHCLWEGDILKEVSDYNRVEYCQECKVVQLTRIFTTFQFSGSKNEWPEYNVGLGQVIKNKKERKEIVKQNNFVEVGNYKADNYGKDMDKRIEDKLAASWEGV